MLRQLLILPPLSKIKLDLISSLLDLISSCRLHFAALLRVYWAMFGAQSVDIVQEAEADSRNLQGNH